MAETRSYGFDPGLRHGAFVLATFDQSQKDKRYSACLSDLTVVYKWTKSSDLALGERSSPEDVFRLTQHIVSLLRDKPVYPIAIDWDPYSIFWRSRKLQAVTLALFIGYFSRAVHSMGFPIVYISPTKVREAMNLPNRTEKEVLQDWFSRSVSIEHYQKLMSSDMLDAVILSYLMTNSHYPQVNL